ncbi:MAG TPA: class I SAM-dependent methyltransferase, partial [Candidatus Kryptobacter bacterium]|nr:class I SAM-dependent methyltransferase [Candidatus Kryptobacter bacterium]
MNRCSDYITHYRTDAEHFDYFTDENRTTLAYEKLFRKFIARLAGSHRTVVDIGSGGGWSSIIPHERIFFVDLSAKNLSVLKSETSGPVMADAHRLPFRSNSVEFVIASEIIEHLNDPAAAAGEIWRVLKPGGRAVVSTPYKEKLRYTLCIHCNQVTPWNAHLHSFDEKMLLGYFPPEARKRAHIFG